MGMTLLKQAVNAAFFLMELAALASLTYWGFKVGANLYTRVLLGIGSPVLTAIFWGTFIAPRASRRVSVPFRVVLQALVFGLAFIALRSAGETHLATAYLSTVIIVLLLTYGVFRERK